MARLDSLMLDVIFSGMSLPSPDPSESRLLLLRANPEILNVGQVQDVYEDLTAVEAALATIRDGMDHRDPRFARVDASLADLRAADTIGFDTHHIDYDDHQAAFEWIHKRKAEAIKVLVPALALLDELAGKNTSQAEVE